jgi:hypothetical protein
MHDSSHTDEHKQILTSNFLPASDMKHHSAAVPRSSLLNIIRYFKV